MHRVPDPRRAGPGRRGRTSTGLHKAEGAGSLAAPGRGKDRGSGIPQVGGSMTCFPLPLLWPSSAPPHPLQAKEAPNFPPTSPGARWEMWV